MKGKQQAAVYLTCTKHNSFQRKHIEVCKRCPSNRRCKPYLEFRRSIQGNNGLAAPTAGNTSQLLNQMIRELQEIKELALDEERPSRAANRSRNIRRSAQHRVILEIKTALMEIRSLC